MRSPPGRFGGKRKLANAIAQELGKHTQYYEPFCSSMAVLFAKNPSQKETVNDLHGDLINLARVLQVQSLAEDLYDRCQRAIVSEGLLNDAKAYLKANPLPDPDLNDVERAYWYFLSSWMSRNGTAGTKRVDYQLAVRWTCGGGSPTVRWRNVVQSIPWFHARLLNVVVLQRDAFDFIHKFEDKKGTAVYVDSPYTAKTREGYRGGKGSDHQYVHEFNHAADHAFKPGRMFKEQCDVCGNTAQEHKSDHERLRDVLAQYKHARIVVSYYDCEEIRELYDGWTFVKHTRQKHMHSAGGRGRRPREAKEVLIINGKSYGSAA